MRTRIVQLAGDFQRIELFSLHKIPGWDCGGTRWSLTVVKGNWSPKSRCRPPNDEFCGQVEKCWMALHSRLSQINRLVHRPLFEKIPYACWYWDQAYWRTPLPVFVSVLPASAHPNVPHFHYGGNAPRTNGALTAFDVHLLRSLAYPRKMLA